MREKMEKLPTYSKLLRVSRGFSHSSTSGISPPLKHSSKWEQILTSNAVFYNPDPTYSLRVHHFSFFNSYIATLSRQGSPKDAKKLFNEMQHSHSDRDIASCAWMITAYLKNGELSNAEKLYCAMPRSNVVVDSAMIDAYAKANRMEDAYQVFAKMKERNVFSWTSLISGCLRTGMISRARELFHQMPYKNVVSWTTMVLGLARNGLIDDARQFFDGMPEKNVVAWTAMIKCYVENSLIDEARKLFDKMPFRNLFSWNIMITGYLDLKRVNEAMQLFKLMPKRNIISWTTLITGLARNKLTKIARECFDEMPQKDIAAWNAMITAYVENGLINEAVELFNSMPERNTITWNTMIDGYSRNGLEQEALKHLILMLRASFDHRPNEATITSVVCASESILELVQVHALVIMLGFELQTMLTNALVTMYSRNGDIDSAQLAFENIKAKDVVSWTSMISAYSNHGFGHLALQTFARMLRSGSYPDNITFVGVLSACSHAGLLEKGLRIFHSMSQGNYGVKPMAEHYSCIIDLLGRSGKVNEALRVASQVPACQRDGSVVGALLGACKLYGDAEVANQIGEELIRMEPTNSGGYILLANVYAAGGRWHEFANIRKRMKQRKVNKVAGYSEIVVKKRHHVFFAGDILHPELKEIYAMLEEKLLPQMKEIGNYCSPENIFLPVP